MKLFQGLAVLAAQGLLVSSVLAQTFTMGTETALVGDEEVTVDWSLTGMDGEGIVSYGIDVVFDETLITPQLSTGIEVDNCATATGGAAVFGCNLINSTTIRISGVVFSGELGNANGSITFDILGDPAAGDFTDLDLSHSDPAGEAIALVEGRLTIDDPPPGPQSTLAISANLDFGTVNLANMPPPAQTFTVTATFESGADPVAISDVTLSNTDQFSIASNTCASASLTPASPTCTVEIVFDADAAGPFNGTLTVQSDADNNSTVVGNVTGIAQAAAIPVVSPGFGAVPLGIAAAGTTLTEDGFVRNDGSANFTLQCNLVDNNDPAVFSTSLPSTLITVEPGEPEIPFTVSCALPSDAEDGASFTAEIQCSVDGDPVTADTTHFLSCGVREFDPLPVPTMSKWSLTFFALLMLLVGGFSIRFFRT